MFGSESGIEPVHTEQKETNSDPLIHGAILTDWDAGA